MAAKVIVDMLDAVAVGGDREIAPLGCGSAQVRRREVQRAQSPGGREGVHAAVAPIVSERRADGVVDRTPSVVLDVEGKQRRRHRGVAIVVGDERAERRHPHLPRERVAPEFELGHGKAPDKCDVVEMRNAGEGIAIGPEAVSVEFSRARRAGRIPLIGPVQDPRVQKLAVALRLDCEVAIAVELMDRGAVADAPIDEAPRAGERDAARSDAAEGKRNIFAALPRIDEPLVDRIRRPLVRHLVSSNRC